VRWVRGCPPLTHEAARPSAMLLYAIGLARTWLPASQHEFLLGFQVGCQCTTLCQRAVCVRVGAVAFVALARVPVILAGAGQRAVSADC
jgi:hypothetical protein